MGSRRAPARDAAPPAREAPRPAAPEPSMAAPPVGNQALQRILLGGAPVRLGGKDAPEERAAREGHAPRTLARAERTMRGGEPLPPSTRERLEASLGTPLDHVRVRHDADAARAAASLDARAFALGADVAFAEGAYRPGTPEGDRLIAHEVAHVAQEGSPYVARRQADPELEERRKRLDARFGAVRRHIESNQERFREDLALEREQPGVAWVTSLFGTVEPPDDKDFDRAWDQYWQARKAFKGGDLAEAERLLADADSSREAGRERVTAWREGRESRGETSIKVLRGAEVAGTIAAGVATGGAGSTLVGGAALAAGGAGAYGATQAFAGQGGEMIAGTRESFDAKAILARGATDAVMTFVGALTGGVLTRYAAGRIAGRLAQMGDAELLALGQRLGLQGGIPRQALAKGGEIVADFLGNVGSTFVTSAVQAVVRRVQGREEISASEFVEEFAMEIAQGQALDALVRLLTRGRAGHGTGRHDAAAPKVETPRRAPSETPRVAPEVAPPAKLPAETPAPTKVPEEVPAPVVAPEVVPAPKPVDAPKKAPVEAPVKEPGLAPQEIPIAQPDVAAPAKKKAAPKKDKKAQEAPAASKEKAPAPEKAPAKEPAVEPAPKKDAQEPAKPAEKDGAAPQKAKHDHEYAKAKQDYLRKLAENDGALAKKEGLSKADVEWLKREKALVDAGKRDSMRVPPGKNVGHKVPLNDGGKNVPDNFHLELGADNMRRGATSDKARGKGGKKAAIEAAKKRLAEPPRKQAAKQRATAKRHQERQKKAHQRAKAEIAQKAADKKAGQERARKIAEERAKQASEKPKPKKDEPPAEKPEGPKKEPDDDASS